MIWKWREGQYGRYCLHNIGHNSCANFEKSAKEVKKLKPQEKQDGPRLASPCFLGVLSPSYPKRWLWTWLIGSKWFEISPPSPTANSERTHSIFPPKLRCAYCSLCVQNLIAQTEFIIPLKKTKEAISMICAISAYSCVIFSIYITCSLYLTST